MVRSMRYSALPLCMMFHMLRSFPKLNFTPVLSLETVRVHAGYCCARVTVGVHLSERAPCQVRSSVWDALVRLVSVVRMIAVRESPKRSSMSRARLSNSYRWMSAPGIESMAFDLAFVRSTGLPPTLTESLSSSWAK